MPFSVHDPLPELCATVVRHGAGAHLGDRLTLWVSDARMEPRVALWEPVLYLVLQGKKRLTKGEQIFEYGVGKFLLGGIHIPVLCEVVEASMRSPYVGVALALDPAVVSSLLLETKQVDQGSTDADALTIGSTTVEMYDAFLRLVRLLDRPEDAVVLAPMIERELLYRVLQTPHGAMLRQLAQSESRLSQIQRAAAWIRQHPTARLSIDAIAAHASMSSSTFFRRFKSVIGMSPLAYQKQIRLHEARRRLLVEPGAVASVAFAVGYESTSQFSREYARQFGMSPARDAARLRAAL